MSETPSPERAELDADGRRRPEFLHGFPEHPLLEPLIEAFSKGNYAFVREHAERVAQETDGAVRDAALELRRRIEPERVAVWLYLGALAFLVFVALWMYSLHEH